MELQKVTYIDLVTIIEAQNLNDIQDAIIDLEEWQTEAGAAIPQILANIAPSFSNSTSYSAGDCVIVLDKLYQFTADHPAGDWTGTDAEEVNVTSLLKEAAASLSGDIDSVKADALTAYATDTASGSIASFPDGADDIPVKDLSVGIEPVQSGSGDPSPDNIRPISGWTGAEVTRTGKNLLDTAGRSVASSGSNIIRPSNCTVSKSGNVLTVTDLGAWAKVRYGVEPGDFKTGVTYTVSAYFDNPSGINCGLCLRKNNEWTDSLYTTESGKKSITFTVAESDSIVEIALLTNNDSSAVSGTLVISDVQLELGSTPTAYEPYAGDTYSITFPSAAGTVYGGTLDVTTGKLTVDRVFGSKLLSQMTQVSIMDTTTRYEGQLFFGTGANIYGGASGNGKTICNLLGVYAYNTNDDIHYYVTNGGSINAFVPNGTPNDTEIQVIATLATPTVYDLTPTEVRTLLAQNNIWADCGDSTVEYRADTKLYIDKKIAALAAAMN